jgi:hypothetical protein
MTGGASREELIELIARELSSPSRPRKDRTDEVNRRCQRLGDEFTILTGIPARSDFAALASIPPTDAEVRDARLELGAALERAAQASEQLKQVQGGIPTGLSDLRRDAERVFASAKQVKVRSVRNDAFPKKLCAFYALDLMLECSTRMPSAVANGPYRTVASLLWEIFTGECAVDLERQCRAALKFRPSRGAWKRPSRKRQESFAKLAAKADKLLRAEPSLTKAQAIARVYADPTNAELVADYKFHITSSK